MRIKPLSAPNLTLLVAIGYTVGLLMLSLVNTHKLYMPKFSNADKLFHTTAYFGLTLFWYLHHYARYVHYQLKLKPLAIISLAAIGFGILIEVLQLVLTNYRSFDVYDMMANSVGSMLALLFMTFKKMI